MTDPTIQEQLEAVADEDGTVAVEDAQRIAGTRRVPVSEAVQIAGGAPVPSLDEQIAEAQRTGDISLAIRLKRHKHRKGLAESRAAANGGSR